MRNMKRSRVKGVGCRVRNALGIVVAALLFSPFTSHPSPAFAEPTPDELRGTIRQHILKQEKGMGAFTIPDPLQIGKLRNLELVRVHERVGKTGDYYYSCTDMRDVATGELLDLDFDISDSGKTLKVVAVRIHKDDGDPRYTYDDNDNLIPLR